MKNIVLIGILCMFITSAFPQDRNSIWCFGDSAGIDFRNPSNPVTFKTGIRSRSDCASIADENGNLLFYVGSDTTVNVSSGFVYNRNHQQMPFGWGLKLGNWNHEVIIFPMPGDPDKYYIFHTSITQSLGIFYSIVDMSMDNGYGDVVVNNVTLATTSVTDGVAAVKHANGRDWWLIYAKRYQSAPTNMFIEYLITPAGISAPTIINIGNTHQSGAGDLNFSDDGEKFIFTTISNLVEVFDFDRCTGALSNPVVVKPESTGGEDFAVGSGVLSPDKNLVYITYNADTSYVYQYDLRVNPVSSSRVEIAMFTDILFCTGMLRLAPDNKIYLSNAYQNLIQYFFPYADSVYNYFNMNLSVINSPDSAGVACDFQPYSFYLGGSRTYLGLPNNPNYELQAVQGSICDSLISVKEIKDVDRLLAIYPNPFSDRILINPVNETNEIVTIDIQNDTGQNVFTTETFFAKQELDLSHLPKGIYFLRITSNSVSLVKRLIRI